MDIVATRNELYRQFGPQLLEAVCRVMLREINIVRENPTAVLAPRTDQDMIDAIAAELDSQPNFDWQT